METAANRSAWPLLLLLAAACGGRTAAPAPNAPPAGANADPAAKAGGGHAAADAAPARALAMAFVVPRLATVGLQSSRSMVAEGVWFATAQSGLAGTGQIARTGTIAITQAGARYTPTPGDKLVVRAGGEVHEFEAIEAVGDATADSASAWLQAPHRLAYRHRIPDRAEAHVDEQFDGRAFSVAVDGFTAIDGGRCELALKARGGTQGNGGLDGREVETAYAVTGTLRGAEAEVDVQEQHRFAFASAQSLAMLYSQRGWASRFTATIGSTVRAGGATYRFQDVRVQTDAKEKGGQRSDDVVAASGAILRAEKPFATLSLQGAVPVATTTAGAFPLQVAISR